MYENKGYDNKMYPKLMLHKLKVMEGSTFIDTPLGTQFNEASIEVSMCAHNNKAYQKAS